MWLPKHDILKECSPHYCYGIDRQGVRVNWEVYGGLDPGWLKEAGVSRDDIEKQIAWMGAFTQRIYGSHDSRSITVMDMKGMSLRKASNPFMLSLSKWYSETLENYFPGNLQRVLIINPPFGTSAIVKVMTAVLPASYVSKIEIVHNLKDLQKYIDPRQIPTQYGGSNTTPLEDSPFEQKLREFRSDTPAHHMELSRIPEMSAPPLSTTTTNSISITNPPTPQVTVASQ